MKRHSIGLLVFALLVFIVAACSGGTTSVVAAQGTEHGACYPNNTCNAGLTCLSDTCVSPAADGGAGGDSSFVDSGGQSDASADSSTSVESSTSDARDDAGNPCPGANILHPGTETRNVNTSVPFVGRGRDASCTAITGAKLVWVDSLEGPIGTGETFNHTFTMTGTHMVTLTATDGQGGKVTASITFMII